jgi:hypothetical protein
VPGGPVRQLHQIGGLGHPGAVADTAVSIDRRLPTIVGGEHLGGLTRPGIDHGPKKNPTPARRYAAANPWVAPAESERIKICGASRLNLRCVQVIWPRTRTRRQRVQRLAPHHDVIGGAVATGQGLPGSDVGTAQKHWQRVETEGVFPGRGRILLISGRLGWWHPHPRCS